MSTDFTPRARTLAQEMAIAILRDDWAAAISLADMLINEVGPDKQADLARRLRENYHGAHDGHGVYAWPEFQAFCRRAGILWDLRTISMVITINEGMQLTVDHVYAGVDTEIPRHNTTVPKLDG